VTEVEQPNWFQWHERYDEPGSQLQRRLAIVRRRIAEALDAMPAGPVTAISMCAGQGRDLLGVLADHPRRADVRARLVELDPNNAGIAERTAQALELPNVHVVTGDASDSTAYAGNVPADLVLVCGVFGSLSDDDIRHTVEQLPRLCAPGATVVWTRYRGDGDITPAVRGWFADAGFTEVAFDTAEDAEFGVGTHRLSGPPLPFEPGIRLFHFGSAMENQ
jgi:hypothetical protein